MDNVNRELSAQVAEAVGTESSQCWLNAWQALQCDGRLAGGFYVEGWVVDGDALVYEHGWVELADQIVDPTLYAENLTYFAGLRFDQETAKRELDRRRELPLAWAHGWGGSESVAYRDAWESARDFSSRLFEERR